MEINTKLISLLQLLSSHLSSDPSLIVDKDSVSLSNGSVGLLKITSNNIFLLTSNDVESLILDPHLVLPEPFPVREEKFAAYLAEIAKSGLRLNHLGIKYFCNTPVEEINRLKALASGQGLTVFKEAGSGTGEQWLFIGDISDWKNPLFEVVLTSKKPYSPYEWTPHFQIDIDTNLSAEELNTIADKYLWPDFYNWHLDDSGVGGTVLCMGLLGVASGTKVCLGVGTKLRNTQYHREHLLIPV